MLKKFMIIRSSILLSCSILCVSCVPEFKIQFNIVDGRYYFNIRREIFGFNIGRARCVNEVEVGRSIDRNSYSTIWHIKSQENKCTDIYQVEYGNNIDGFFVKKHPIPLKKGEEYSIFIRTNPLAVGKLRFIV